MNTDVMFWWTGWATWLVISCVIAIVTLVGSVMIVRNALVGLKAWAGVHIIRNSVAKGDWDAVDRWPKLNDDHKTDIVMAWLRSIVDAEKNRTPKEEQGCYPSSR